MYIPVYNVLYIVYCTRNEKQPPRVNFETILEMKFPSRDSGGTREEFNMECGICYAERLHEVCFCLFVFFFLREIKIHPQVGHGWGFLFKAEMINKLKKWGVGHGWRANTGDRYNPSKDVMEQKQGRQHSHEKKRGESQVLVMEKRDQVFVSKKYCMYDPYVWRIPLLEETAEKGLCLQIFFGNFLCNFSFEIYFFRKKSFC